VVFVMVNHPDPLNVLKTLVMLPWAIAEKT